jgi:hypothetical protein
MFASMGAGTDARIVAIANDSWRGQGGQLLALLADPAGDVRSAAAVRIGQLLSESAVGLPDRRVLFEILRQGDAKHPGVADAFWTTVRYEDPLDDSFDLAALKVWMLEVLESRRERRCALSPVPGNDLEFYAHETLDDDFDALMRLIAAGYFDIVEAALEHAGALPAEQVITLLRAMFERTKQLRHAQHLAVVYALVLEEARPSWPCVHVSGVRAPLISIDYAYRRLWTVHWLLFDLPAAKLTRANDEALLFTLVEAGIPLDVCEASLDPSAIKHIAFPGIAATTRVVRRPRADLQIDMAVTEHDCVAALRIVRARLPVR